MTKLHSELVRKSGESTDMIPGGTFRLRFAASDQPFITPHFSAILDLGKPDQTHIASQDAVEVDFTVSKTVGNLIIGTYIPVKVNMDDILIDKQVDYAAEIPDVAQEKPPLTLPSTLDATSLTSAVREKDNSYPEPDDIKVSAGKVVGQLAEHGKITFEVSKWKVDKRRERTSWIVYAGYNSDQPILYYPYENNADEKSDVNKKGFTREIDFSQLPLGKYRVEAIGKWGLWHADQKQNRFGTVIEVPKKPREDYAYFDFETTEDRLTDIKDSGTSKLIAPDESVTFSTGSLFGYANSLTNMTWTVSDGKGEIMQNQTTGVQTSSINLKFPTPSTNTVLEYTLKATSGSGLTTERKIQVNFLKRKGETELVDKTIPKDQRARAGAKTIAISEGPHNGSKVGLRPVTFRVTSPDKDADFSWIVYQGKDATYPIDIQFDYGREFTVDFSKLPEGDYMVEAFGRVSQWHSNHGKDRFGEPVNPSKVFAKMKVTSTPNVLESVTSKKLIKGEKSKQWETNWGVPVVFDADLLFDYNEDIAQLEWEITDKDSNPVFTDQTLAAKGNAHPTFTFDQPTTDTEYTLKVTLNGVSKTQKFIVVAQAYVKNIQLTGDANKFVYNQQRTLKFSVKDYTQLQPNTSDQAKVKWVRVFFPDVHYEDFQSEQLVYIYKDGVIVSAKFGAHTTTNVQVFEGKGDKLDIAAGIPETTATNSPYKKGLYFVEAYMNKPDGKRGAMDFYELTRNEPTAISQYQVRGFNDFYQVPIMAFVRPGIEYFAFAVNSWQFGAPLGEENNVTWALYDADGTTLVKTFGEKGMTVVLNFGFLTIPDGESKDYVLKAYTGDVARGSSLNVRAAKPKITHMFFADSTGRRIKECGVGDKVYMYAKTIGLENEEVQLNIFELDRWGDDLVKGQLIRVNEKGVLFQEIELTKELLEAYEGKENPFDLYLTMSFDTNKPFVLPNKSFTRSQVHYREVEDALLKVTYDVKVTDFGFFDANWQPLKGAVKVGDKVNVRVRVTNVGEAKFHIYISDLHNKEMPLSESGTDLQATEEGYLEMEFVVPEGWYDGDGTKARFFYPFARTTGWAVTLKPTFELADVGKMLKVAKDPATTPVFTDATEYADIAKSETISQEPLDNLRFPLDNKPLNAEGEVYGKMRRLFGNAEGNWTKYGANRSHGHRKHGGIDMYTPALTAVYPITTGKVLYAGPFYLGTWEVTVEHDIEIVPGYKLIVRYGEMDASSVTVSTGDTVNPKDALGKTGYLEENGAPLVTIDGEIIYMLHLEMYTGESGNDLSTTPLTDKGNGAFQRRDDLMDPESLLIRMYNNQFLNDDGSKTYFTEEDAKVGLKYILDNYGRDYAIGVERIYRAETTHFASDQYLLCGTPGMEAVKGSTEPYYGWSADIFSKHPDSVAVGTVSMMEGKGLSDQGGLQQNTTDAKRFIKMKSVTGAMVVVAERIKKADGNFGAWYANDVDMRAKYNTEIEKITPKIVNEME